MGMMLGGDTVVMVNFSQVWIMRAFSQFFRTSECAFFLSWPHQPADR